MSRTTRRHESASRAAKRGPKNKSDEDLTRPVRKTSGQRRRLDKQSLRKEWR